MDVHYTWIGPPPTDRNRDITAPKALATRCAGQSVKIYFWCLDAHVATYERDFAAHKNVTVRGMQAFLTKAGTRAYRWYYWYQESDDWAVAAMTDILDWGLALATPPSYRAFVKDAWSLFLMYTWGGYVLDAGVGPQGGGTFALPEPQAFMAPSLTRDDALMIRRFQLSRLTGWQAEGDVTFNESRADEVCEAMNYGAADDGEGEMCPQLEVWMLGSPRYSKGAWAALKQYCVVWKEMQQNNTLVSTTAPQVFRYLIAGSVYNGLTRTQKGGVQAPHGALWYCTDNKNGTVDVPDLKLRKTYHGSSAQ
ncbi:hypothetical protein HRD49_08730 [Corallococcus exiguus]|uniref:hypothetical protein n=1 Tax=Corallococcus TaxID=83461 RepID=UPI000EEE3391|nr:MULTISPECIES: hypothetical protein [Corallococcus]NRD53690.1 hypothetical protein [Corallococcus exiguus]NRD61840.1 hypothetical protein [Corallococcus exiguus]RKI12135.1 hypothetical protein D7Y15_18965 [Corallococcus sp. AB030]RUO92328.1 hypothetical protein D7Y11_15290 [Corallococcus sp. AB018]